jgi:universal stress protein E
MDSIHNILAIVDPTADLQPAVSKSALLAESIGARLELFVCDTPAARAARWAAHLESGRDRPFVRDLKELVESHAAPLRVRGLDVTTEVVVADGPLHAALMERVKHTSAGLVVKDTHHHSFAHRTFLTNTDWQLIRCCPVPLLLTKPKLWAGTPKILAAIDPGHANDKPMVLDHRILDYAMLLGYKLAAELHVAHVFLPMAAIAAAASGDGAISIAVTAEDLRREEVSSRQRVAAAIDGYAIAPANIHVEAGGTVEILPRIAGNVHADIVVMGAISRSGLQRIFIGSTAEDVLEHLPSDVLIVKPLDFADSLPF